MAEEKKVEDVVIPYLSDDDVRKIAYLSHLAVIDANKKLDQIINIANEER